VKEQHANLGLYAGHAVEDRDGAVEDPEGPLHFQSEVDVARGVDDVHLRTTTAQSKEARQGTSSSKACASGFNKIIKAQLYPLPIQDGRLKTAHDKLGCGNAQAKRLSSMANFRCSASYSRLCQSNWRTDFPFITWWSSQKQVVAAEVMVMPRSCSCTIQSMVAPPSCTC